MKKTKSNKQKLSTGWVKFNNDVPVYPDAFCVDLEVKSGKEKITLPWKEWCEGKEYTKLCEFLRSGVYTEWKYKKNSAVSYRDYIKETLKNNARD